MISIGHVKEKPARPIGGDDKFRKNIVKMIGLSPRQVKRCARGKVFVQFVIEKDGSLRNIKIIKGYKTTCNDEAVRVLTEFSNTETHTQKMVSRETGW